MHHCERVGAGGLNTEGLPPCNALYENLFGENSECQFDFLNGINNVVCDPTICICIFPCMYMGDTLFSFLKKTT